MKSSEQVIFGHYDKRIRLIENECIISLVIKWLILSLRLFKHYPIDVLWNPIGIVWLSLRGKTLKQYIKNRLVIDER